MSRYLGDAMWTVTVTLKVWPDKPGESPIEDEVRHAVERVLDERNGERCLIDVHRPVFDD